MSTFTTLFLLQEELEGLISRAVSNLKKKGEANITASYVQGRIDALSANWNTFLNNHVAIMELQNNELLKHKYFANHWRDKCEESYITNKSTMLDMLQKFSGTQIVSRPTQDKDGAECRSSHAQTLPQLNLPTFSGSYKEWAPYRDLFTSIVISNVNLPPVEKCQYLKTTLTGEALQLIAQVAVTGENFERAWNKLRARFGNKRALIDTQLDVLFSMKKATSLETLGCVVSYWGPILIYWVTRKLDAESLKEWELHLGDQHETPRFVDLEKFLAGRIRAFEAVERLKASARGSGKARNSPPHSERSGTTVRTHQTSVHQTSCSMCHEAHYLAACPVYLSKPTEQRREFLVQQRLCFNCLGPHQVRTCRITKRCRKCRGHHHTSIHPLTGSGKDSSVATSSGTSGSGTTKENAVAVGSFGPVIHHVQKTFLQQGWPQSMLATAMAKLVPPHGDEEEIRILLDQGSEISFVSEALVQRHNIPRQQASLPMYGMGGKWLMNIRGVCTISLCSRLDPGFGIQVKVFVLSRITKYAPDTTAQNSKWSHLAGLSLADPLYDKPGPIDLALGSDYYGRLLKSGVLKGGDGDPIAQDTHLGWVISGPTSGSPTSTGPTRARGYHISGDQELLNLLQRFWKHEEHSSHQKSALTDAAERCEAHCDNTHSRNSEGRYVVRLPLKREVTDIGDSRLAALRILMRNEKRLCKDLKLKREYENFMLEYVELNHMRPASESEVASNISFYLPHHAVHKTENGKTKLRVVFNGSHRADSGRSLNDCLLIGPKLQIDLADVLLRWRRYAFAFSADIAKMYRQILVHQDDQNLQRILWRQD